MSHGYWCLIETIVCFWCWLCYLLTLEGVRRQRLPLRALMYYRPVTGGSVDGWFLCGGVKLQEAECAKIPVVREVKSGQAFAPCDYADVFGCPPGAAYVDSPESVSLWSWQTRLSSRTFVAFHNQTPEQLRLKSTYQSNDGDKHDIF